MLRLSVMCTGDLSLYTFTRDDGDTFSFNANSKSERKCSDWSQIENWTRKKRTSMHKGLLVPTDFTDH